MIEIGPIGPNVSDTFSKRLFWIGADVLTLRCRHAPCLGGTHASASIVGSQNCDTALFAWGSQPQYTAQFSQWYANTSYVQSLCPNLDGRLRGTSLIIDRRSVIDAAEHAALFGDGAVLNQLIFKFLTDTLPGESSFFTVAEPKEWMQNKVRCRISLSCSES